MKAWSLRLQPRTQTSARLHLTVTVLALLFALLLGALLLAAAGLAPLTVYGAMARASLFGGAYALVDTAVKATPLVLCGLGCALAFRARLWNVGAEGQLLLGAWAATAVASFVLPPNTPSLLMILSMIGAAICAGGALAALAGWLRARLGVSEILTTLMLVYVVTHFNNFWIFGPWSQGGFPLTPAFPDSARLGRLSDLAVSFPALAGLTLHWGFALALVLAGVIAWGRHRTRLGFDIDVVGASPQTARSVGIDVGRVTVLTLFLSGALAGLAGMVEVSGVVYRLQERLSPGYGFTAIIVAWLARLHPLAVVAVALLMGALLVGSREVQPAGVAQLLQGVILVVVVGAELFVRYQIQWRRHG